MPPDRDEIVLTGPNMDYIAPVLGALFTGLGCRFVLPPPISDATRAKGRELGREGLCHPLNSAIGDLHFAMQQGANAVVMTTERDFCRYGFFWAVQKAAVEESCGHEVPFFNISDAAPQQSVKTILKKIGISVSEEVFQRVWYCTMLQIDALAELTNVANRARPFATRPGEIKRLHQAAATELLACRSPEAVNEVFNRAVNALLAFRPRPAPPLPRVLLIGELFEVIEPTANYQIEEQLARLGVEVQRSLSLHDLVPFVAREGGLRYRRDQGKITSRVAEFIAPELASEGFGGFARLTIGHAAGARADGFDGLVHLYSFSCMPEIIAKPFLQRISERDDIPILTIVVEELTGDAAFHNRLEAFVALLKQKVKR